ncbi:MAG: class I SAM-dependent RNA methyltransferase [Pseudomonadota bacterium]
MSGPRPGAMPDQARTRAPGAETAPLGLFLAGTPGLEPVLAGEAGAPGLGLEDVRVVPGGVEATGDWPAVWRANLGLATATRVLVRLATFRAMHLAQLDKRLRRIDWSAVVAPGMAVSVEASCRRSRIYHQRAAAERLATALTDAGAQIAGGDGAGGDGARGDGARGDGAGGAPPPLAMMLRIEDDLATVSVDSSGEALHRRGAKQAVGPAPLRETLAAAFLAEAGFDGIEPVVDPMCGSGTFVIEAATRAAGLAPGRLRHFAFERFAGHDAGAYAVLRQGGAVEPAGPARYFGADRDIGAIRMSEQNAARAGVTAITAFDCHSVSDLECPDTAPGLVMVNPPYGGRIGDRRQLGALHAALGRVLMARFAGWRVGLVTSEAGLARATGLPFAPPGPPVPHGGLKVRLWQTGKLGGKLGGRPGGKSGGRADRRS